MSTLHSVIRKQLSEIGQSTEWHFNAQPCRFSNPLRHSTLNHIRLTSPQYPVAQPGHQQLSYWTWHSWPESSHVIYNLESPPVMKTRKYLLPSLPSPVLTTHQLYSSLTQHQRPTGLYHSGKVETQSQNSSLVWNVICNIYQSCGISHYSDVIMRAMASPITGVSIVWVFTQLLVQAQIKENIKALRHWPLCGEFTGDRWIVRTKGQ